MTTDLTSLIPLLKLPNQTPRLLPAARPKRPVKCIRRHNGQPLFIRSGVDMILLGVAR